MIQAQPMLVGYSEGTKAMVQEYRVVQYRPNYFAYGPDQLVNQVV